MKDLPPNMRECPKCHLPQDLDSGFYGRRGKCRECILAPMRTGRPVGTPPALTPGQKKEAARLYIAGKSQKEVGRILGVDIGVIWRALASLKTPKRSSRMLQKVTNERVFAQIDTPEKAYWLGFLATDGNVYGSRIQINLSGKDHGHLEKFAHFLSPALAVKKTFRRGLGKRTQPYPISTLAFRSTAMVADLLLQGIGPKKSFTINPWNGPKDLLPHYWRGCVDGDGWVTEDAVGFCGNYTMVSGFKNWLEEQGIKINSNVNPYRRIFTFSVSGKLGRQQTLRSLRYQDQPALERKRLAATLYDPSPRCELAPTALPAS